MADTTTRADRSGEAGPELTGPRRLWSGRVVALVVAAAVLVVLVVFGIQLLDRSQFESTTFAGPIDRVDVRLARGDIDLVPASEGSESVLVERTLHWRFSRPRAESVADADRGRVTVEADCPRVVIVIGTCSVDYVIQVPSGVQINVRTDSGTVSAEGLDGWVRVVTDGGEVIGSDLAAPQVLVDSAGGDVALGFVEPPGRVEVVSGGGGVTVVVPGGPYDVRAAVGAGEVLVDVPDDPDAERDISIDSGSGDVQVAPS